MISSETISKLHDSKRFNTVRGVVSGTGTALTLMQLCDLAAFGYEVATRNGFRQVNGLDVKTV
jgi:hypothetical protein